MPNIDTILTALKKETKSAKTYDDMVMKIAHYIVKEYTPNIGKVTASEVISDDDNISSDKNSASESPHSVPKEPKSVSKAPVEQSHLGTSRSIPTEPIGDVLVIPDVEVANVEVEIMEVTEDRIRKIHSKKSIKFATALKNNNGD